VFVVEDGDALAYEAACDSSSVVDGFNDGILYLGVSDGGVVSCVRLGADESVWADDGWISCITLANGVHPTVYG